MSQTNSTASNGLLTRKMISYLDGNLTPKERTLLTTLYKYSPLKHKDLAQTLDMTSSSLTNLIKRINLIQQDFIQSEPKGRYKFYSLSQMAAVYTEIILLPKEEERNNARVSFLQNDLITNTVWDILKNFQEFEGEDWDIVLDDLLFIEIRHNFIAGTNAKEALSQNYNHIKEETYQNYTDLKNALINLIIQQGKQSAQKIYDILKQKILAKRLDTLLSTILKDFYQMEPLFHLEQKDLPAAYSVIDKIFAEHFSDIFGENSLSYADPLLPAEYYSIYSAIINMTKEFKQNHYEKAVSIEQWEKKFHTGKHFNCLSYIAEKCNTVYIRQSK